MRFRRVEIRPVISPNFSPQERGILGFAFQRFSPLPELYCNSIFIQHTALYKASAFEWYSVCDSPKLRKK